MNQEQEKLSMSFKQAFTGPHGTDVLANLKTFCRGNLNQSCFDMSSDRQTSYNLGANSVYRYIQSWIEMKSDEIVEDCIGETK